MKKLLLFTLFWIGSLALASGQTTKVPLSLSSWDTLGVKSFVTETFQGKECIVLTTGFISVRDAELRDGVIEMDVNLAQQRGFPGVVFRVQDENNFETFYMRPHQSGNPDATQYTPVFNGMAGWQLYHGEGFSKAYSYNFNQWHHVKIEIHGLQAEIYIDDMSKPLIEVKELLTGWRTGKFGFNSTGIPFRIANVSYSINANAPAPSAIPVPPNGTGGIITKWDVSNAVSRNLFVNKLTLTGDIKSKLKWSTHPTEAGGIMNLARYGKWSQETNTMIARVTIESDLDQSKVLSFGFSDFVTVYLNDKAIYAGEDNFLSRDYRFLGTIGFFDSLVLPLKKGTNEVWFVLSENFGGWGVKAKLQDLEKIRLK